MREWGSVVEEVVAAGVGSGFSLWMVVEEVCEDALVG